MVSSSHLVSRAPTYLVDEHGEVAPNAAAMKLYRQHQDVRLAVQRLELAAVGACIASMFRRFDGLDRFTFGVDRNFEYDDSGGCHPTYTAFVNDVQQDGFDQRLASDGGEDGASRTAEDVLVEYLEQISDPSDLYQAFEFDSYLASDKLSKTVDRSALATLTSSTIDGLEAFVLLFPDDVPSALSLTAAGGHQP